jgi:hypothetical protein
LKSISKINDKNRITKFPNGKIIYLDFRNLEDLQFVREAYGYAAEEKGWFREQDLVNEYTKKGFFFGTGRYK